MKRKSGSALCRFKYAHRALVGLGLCFFVLLGCASAFAGHAPGWADGFEDDTYFPWLDWSGVGDGWGQGYRTGYSDGKPGEALVGSGCAWSSRNGSGSPLTYRNTTTTIRQTFDLSGNWEEVQLFYAYRMDCDPSWAFLQVFVSGDPGNMGSAVKSYTGRQAWASDGIDLSSHIGDSSVYVWFRFYPLSSGTGMGALLDQVVLFGIAGESPIISGHIRTSSGAGIAGVYVLADNGDSSDQTDANGYYNLTVPHNWSGTIAVGKTGYDFTPPERSYNDVTSPLSNQDFTGIPLHTISARNLRANIYWRTGNYERALEIYRDIYSRRLDSGWDAGMWLKIQVLKHEELREMLREVVTRPRVDAEGVILLQKAAWGHPDFAPVFFLLGERLYEEGSFSRSAGYFSRAWEIGVENTSVALDCLESWGGALFRTGDIEGAGEVFRTALGVTGIPEGRKISCFDWIERCAWRGNDPAEGIPQYL